MLLKRSATVATVATDWMIVARIVANLGMRFAFLRQWRLILKTGIW